MTTSDHASPTSARPLISDARLAQLAARGVQVPRYDRQRIGTGIVHFGPGAFHRVHQACYVDALLEHDPRWGLCEVALQSTSTRDALSPQQWLYTVATLDARPTLQIVGAIRDMLHAPADPARVLQRLAAPETHIVTATITEKGYCLRPSGGLDDTHPDIVHDFANRDRPRSLVGYLARALRLRHDSHRQPLSIISCDNLADNGHHLRRAVLEFIAQQDATLSAWVQDAIAFPCTMVDSIAPATDQALRDRVTEALEVEDRWPVQRESFSQWVIERTAASVQPDWASVGVTLTNDVSAFENAKLRLLNAAHSALAYIGSLAGHDTMAQAMRDTTLDNAIALLMRQDIRPALQAPQGMDLNTYSDDILRRFGNPAIAHRLGQIAWDGSQKLPIRLLPTLRFNLANAGRIDRLCLALAAWLHFLRRRTAAGLPITDPLADTLSDLARNCTGDAAHDIGLLMCLRPVFGDDLPRDTTLRRTLQSAYANLATVSDGPSLAHVLRQHGYLS